MLSKNIYNSNNIVNIERGGIEKKERKIEKIRQQISIYDGVYRHNIIIMYHIYAICILYIISNDHKIIVVSISRSKRHNIVFRLLRVRRRRES